MVSTMQIADQHRGIRHCWIANSDVVHSEQDLRGSLEKFVPKRMYAAIRPNFCYADKAYMRSYCVYVGLRMLWNPLFQPAVTVASHLKYTELD